MGILRGLFLLKVHHKNGGVFLMIDGELREKIKLGLKQVMLQDDQYKIPIMLGETYKITINNQTRIAVRDPLAEVPGLLLDPLTGSFIEICDWEYIQKNGEKL